MSGNHTPSLSDEEEDDLDCNNPPPHLPELQDTLSKWTNYLHGWQERFVVLCGGTLSYYKSEYDTAFGCRGSMSVAKASIQVCGFMPDRACMEKFISKIKDCHSKCGRISYRDLTWKMYFSETPLCIAIIWNISMLSRDVSC